MNSRVKKYYLLKELVVPPHASGACLICFSAGGDLKYLYEGVTVGGKRERYYQMFTRCFHIKMTGQMKTAKLCEMCVTQLLEALAFRRQVEAAEDILNPIIDKKVLKKTKYKNKRKLDQMHDNDQLEDFSFNDTSTEYANTEVNTRTNNTFEKSQENISKRREWYDQEQFSKPSTIYTRPKLDFSSKTCPDCGKVAKSKHALTQHYSYNHTSNFLCELCGKTFVAASKFKQHLDYHSGIRYPCTQCERYYSSKDILISHIKKFHEKNKSCVCRLCGKKMEGPLKRKEHMRDVHGAKYKEYACPQCQKRCATKYRLNKHVRGVHANERNFACTKCERRFLTKNKLNTHLDTVHSDQKNFQCDICGKAVNCRATLQRHLCIHYNIRKYKCIHCTQAFVQSGSLKGHIKTHHKSEIVQS